MDAEQEIIQACIANDPKAQKKLFEMYANKMLGVCSRYCPNIEDARDALHEGFIKVFRLIGNFKGNSALETWVTRIMINTSIDHFKKSIKYIHYESSDDVHALNTETEDAYYLEFEDDGKITSQQLYSVINKLPDGYRLVFNLYALEGYTHKEIAQELDISEGTSKSQLARARKLLKKILKEELNLG